MEGAVAFVLALLAIPFVLPIISWVMARRLRRRVEELEERLVAAGRADHVASRINSRKLKKEGAAPRPAAPPPKAAPVVPPAAAAPSQPAAVAPPPTLTSPRPPPSGAADRRAPSTPPVSRRRLRRRLRRRCRRAAPPPPPARARSAAASDADASATGATAAAAPPPPIAPPTAAAEPAPSWSFDWEQFVGVRLFSAIAGIALVFAAVFFLRYSIDQGWLQPPVRVVIGVIVAIALLVVCDRKAARKYVLLANAMDAAAIAILFATFFAAHSQWDLIPGTTAFGLLALVTLIAVLLSIRRDRCSSPCSACSAASRRRSCCRRGENHPMPLFAYLLLLNVGLAWVAYRSGWIILSVADAGASRRFTVGLGGAAISMPRKCRWRSASSRSSR